MAICLSIVYKDGQTEDIRIGPLGLVAAERKFGAGIGGDHAKEAVLWAGWYLKGKPTGSLDDWLATMDDVTQTEEPVRPLEPEPSPEESQT